MSYLLKSISISYFSVVFYITFLARRRTNNTNYRSLINLDPSDKIRSFQYFHTISEANKYAFLEDFIGNILLFMPLIPALIILFQRNFRFIEVLLILFFSTLLIESMQFVFNRGIFDISDIILNVVGGILGFYICQLIIKFLPTLMNR